MNTTLIQFCGVYYLYNGDKEVEDRGPTIGKYKSAWLANLAMAFLLEMIDQNVLDETKYFGIYHDDGIIPVFPGTWMQTEVEDWLLTFQRAINDKAGNNKLSFTAEVWTPRGEKIKSIFNEHNINFEAPIIIQASSLKENLEELGLKQGNCVIASVNIEAMYPSIKFDVIKIAVVYYARNITDENEIDKVNKCLDLIKFGMNTTLIQFCRV
jgi:hypothetical protein